MIGDSRRTRSLAACALLVAATCRAFPAGIQLGTDRPGNLFPHGGRVNVRVKLESPGSVDWRITDYGGRAVATGATAVPPEGATMEVRELPRGYYELTATAGGQSEKIAFGVVTDRSAGDPPSGRLNVDGATAWLERQGRHQTLARMLRMVGIGWVRERFSWSGTETQKGVVRWQQYDRVADAFTKQGIRVYQIFHDSPGWSHGGRKRTRNPQDLRDVYRFAKRLAEHYKGRVRAWEVWNEPDIFFWPDLGDTFAGVQKAAYLGFKSGDPGLPVLLGSFCRGYCAFDESLFEAGVGEYYDIFNWHIYAPPDRYAATLRRYLDLVKRHGCEGRPVWLSEAGIRLKATEPGGELRPSDERKQAEFVPKSIVWSLAAGTDRHFFFVLPFYLERGVQFGALREDLSPRPGFVAIAAAVDLLGAARYLGQYASPERDGYTALAFDNGVERVLVAWSDAPREVHLDVAAERVALADVVGRREWKRADRGKLKLELGASPRYVIGLGEAVVQRLRGLPRPAGKLPVTRPDRVVVRGQAHVATIDKGANCYTIGIDDFRYAVEVCNLDEKEPVRGRLRVEAPSGWKVEPNEAEVALEPMGRLALELNVTPGAPALGVHKVWVRCGLDERSPGPAVSYFRFDLSRVPPAESLDLVGLGDTSRWLRSTSANGTMAIRSGPDGGVRFEIEFKGAGDRWCYPRAELSPPRDFSEYDGLSFEYRCGAADDSTVVRLQVVEERGSAYLTSSGWKAKDRWTRAVCAFEDLSWGSYSQPDATGKLDTQAIRALLIGLNTPRSEVQLEIRNLRLVRIERDRTE